MKSVNPATNELLKEYDPFNSEKVNSIINLVHTEWESYKTTNFSYRSSLMKDAAEVLRQNKDEYAELMTLEMGKPIAQSEAEVEKCAWVCDYYAENAEKFLSDEPVATDASKSFTAFEPLGIVLAVMPWNFPFWQVFRFAAPALMAGNAGLLKHASNVMGCALAIEDVFRKAGFPEHIFRTLVIPSKQVSEVIENPLVKAVTLTGSTPAGKAVAAAAGKELKKTVLELGGSDPYLILEDANLEAAAEICAASRLINGGQSCIAAKRFIVVESVYDDFKELFLESMRKKKMGDPFNRNNDLGPQATEALRDDLHQQTVKSIEMGAELLLGGTIPDDDGAYYPPTVLGNVKKGMPAFDEELFGPVAPLIKVKDENEAIEAANDTVFGLGAAVFTRDTSRGENIAKKKLQAGACFVNGLVKSDPRLPFGGIKESGYGRELAAFGIREFVNIKAVWIK